MRSNNIHNKKKITPVLLGVAVVAAIFSFFLAQDVFARCPVARKPFSPPDVFL